MITLRIACSAAPSHNTSLRTEAQTVRLACDRCAVVATDERTYYYHYHGQTAVLRLPCPRPDCRASEQPPGRP